MANNETKRSHFVPKTFLKHFSYEGEKGRTVVKTINKKKKDEERELSLKNVCVQKNIYTLDFVKKGAEDRMIIENFYQKEFEDDYDELYEMLTDDNKVDISRTEKTKIIETILSFHFRVAKWLNKSEENQRIFFEKIIEQSEKSDITHLKLKDGTLYDISGKTPEELIREFTPNRKFSYLFNQIHDLYELTNRRLNDDIMIYKTYGHHKFLTSDMPIVLNDGEANLLEHINKYSHVMLNISPDYCVVLIPPEFKDSLRIARNNLRDNSSFIYTAINNDHQYRNAETFLIGNESGIQFHLDNQTIYNTPEAFQTIYENAKNEMKSLKNLYDGFINLHFE